MSTWPEDHFERALAMEPQLRVIDRMVRVLAANAPTRRSRKPYCAGCIWEGILKPLARQWVGWDRADPVEEAPEVPPEGFRIISGAELLALADNDGGRTPATTTSEKWLRGTEAWEAVTSRWIGLLEDADPANGHGIHGATA